MPPQHNLNPIDAVIGALALIISPAAAAAIGPYTAIMLASTAGAAWSIGRRAPEKRAPALWYFFKLNTTAFVAAGGIAFGIERWVGADTRVWTVAPIALIIGAVGDDWDKVLTKIFNVVLRAFGKKIAGDR